jgi:hypothetical protein
MREKNKRLGECLEREVDDGVELFDTENGDAWIWSDSWVDASERA